MAPSFDASFSTRPLQKAYRCVHKIYLFSDSTINLPRTPCSIISLLKKPGNIKPSRVVIQTDGNQGYYDVDHYILFPNHLASHNQELSLFLGFLACTKDSVL